MHTYLFLFYIEPTVLLLLQQLQVTQYIAVILTVNNSQNYKHNLLRMNTQIFEKQCCYAFAELSGRGGR